jgi:excisionase family DNA binding protein
MTTDVQVREDPDDINDLATHPVPYVLVGQLSKYWMVSRRYLYKQIEAGVLEAIRLGPRSFRISTAAALKFEHTWALQSRSREADC